MGKNGRNGQRTRTCSFRYITEDRLSPSFHFLTIPRSVFPFIAMKSRHLPDRSNVRTRQRCSISPADVQPALVLLGYLTHDIPSFKLDRSLKPYVYLCCLAITAGYARLLKSGGGMNGGGIGTARALSTLTFAERQLTSSTSLWVKLPLRYNHA